MNRLKSLVCLFVIVLLVFSIFQCRGRTSDFKMVAEPYQWTDDMIRLGITTPERGLTFKITITNVDEANPLTIEDLTIIVNVKYGDKQKFWKQINTDYVYLPPKGEHVIFIPVDFGYGEIIGKYSAELTYEVGGRVPKQIEPYPFEFRVLSEEQFAKEVEQKKGGITITIPIQITVGGISFVSISILLVYWLWRRRQGY